MKKLFLVILIAAVGSFYMGSCNPDSGLTSPEEPTINKGSEPNWITLPVNSRQVLRKEFSASQRIKQYTGGTIEINESYSGGPLGTVTVSATISFDPQFYDRNLYGVNELITLVVDDETCTSKFSPDMDFLKPATYNVSYTGIDLSGIDPALVNFVYQAEDGSVENMEYDRIDVDSSTGLLSVVNAKIPHFSRFGFVN
ncbi:hypothetical protein ACFLS9_10565 [Bacteroidota bacterium]